METVEVVIRIPKDLYEGIECRNGEMETEYVCDELMKAVDNGTVFPKGHGALKDVQDIINRINLNYNNQQSIDAYSLKDMIATTQTVIPADRGDDNG